MMLYIPGPTIEDKLKTLEFTVTERLRVEHERFSREQYRYQRELSAITDSHDQKRMKLLYDYALDSQ